MLKIILRSIYLFTTLSLLNTVLADDFTLNDLDGKPHKLSDYRGKWVIVNYWATWCPPCLDEMPELVDFHEAHKDKDAIVIGINYEDVDLNYLKEFVDQYFISYLILKASPKKGNADFWGPVMAFPTTVIISPKGDLVVRKVGQIDGAYLEKIIKTTTK